MKRTIRFAGIAAAVAACMLQAAPVLAAGTKTQAAKDASGYSYLAGRQRSVKRNEVYKEAAEVEDEDARKAFLIENGIADTEYEEGVKASYSYVNGKFRR